MDMQQQIINNAFLMIAIKEFFEGSNTTEEEYVKKLEQVNMCIGIVTDIKVSPYYLNINGKYLNYVFYDRHTKTCRIMKRKNLKTKNKMVLNIEENRLVWG